MSLCSCHEASWSHQRPSASKELTMPIVNVNLPDPMKDFVEQEIRSGRFKDASAFVQLLIAEEMEARETSFSEEEKNRIEQLLHEALDSCDRGEATAIRPGEFEDMARRLVAQHEE